jgi:hypothetical protein
MLLSNFYNHSNQFSCHGDKRCWIEKEENKKRNNLLKAIESQVKTRIVMNSVFLFNRSQLYFANFFLFFLLCYENFNAGICGSRYQKMLFKDFARLFIFIQLNKQCFLS